ncbi:hypothetical protein Kfla_5796 [Kribbella flavida DSM 17836]|uniref:DUF2993 domain-containing protein n=1 Tax=Kribbella flavida (strain DSM 17836 / JCM 10339 / NBRC 14399) TaxID=479435 RepID=D2PQ98_KRIFD|nr:DUF2993 domain-containing protein [Kribbella flavida]ADB34800.1 hypothetical protein Kfla_5796 [Kribbella flavida DSM 17836]
MSAGKPRRRFRTLIIVVVILALLGFVADRAAESVAENRLATVAADEAAQYDVRAASTAAEIGGFGFLPQLARGEFSEITVTMDQPTISNVAGEDVTMVMTGIQVPRELLTGGTNTTVVIDNADIKLRMTPNALTKLTAAASGLEGLQLSIVGDKLQARMSVRGFDAVATVRPQVLNGRVGLVVDALPGDVPAAVRRVVGALLGRGVRIPALPFGAKVTGAAVDGQSLVLTATASNVQLSAS